MTTHLTGASLAQLAVVWTGLLYAGWGTPYRTLAQTWTRLYHHSAEGN